MNNNDVGNYGDLRYFYDLEDVNVVIGSQNNWYLMYGTGIDGECKIQDIALEGGLNSKKNTESKEHQATSRMATVEMANSVYDVLIKNAKLNKKIVCNATKDTSLVNIKNMIRKGLADIFDEKGNKIVISKDKKLVYENGNEVSYRPFDEYEDDTIEMLDLEIKPNIEKMIEEKIKVEKYLQLARKEKRMKGVTKEKNIDNMRRELRDDHR